MATIGGTVPTLVDVAKRMDPNGKVAAIAELLSQDNPIAEDMPMLEGNLPTGHQITQRTGLPSVYYRKYNAGVPKSKATTAQVTEAIALMEAICEIDADLAKLNGNSPEFRDSEASAFIEAMKLRAATSIFYSDVRATGEEFLGLTPRFNSLSAPNGTNIIDAGGTGSNNTSIWIVGWSPRTVYGVYPKGSDAGLQVMTGTEPEWAFDGNNNRFKAYIDNYKWFLGLAMPDWRYVVRIANIDVTQLTKNAATGADLTDLVAQALEKIHSTSGVNVAIYGNRTVGSFLRRQVVNKVGNSTLTMEKVAGTKDVTLDGFLLRRTDALLNTEARVV